MVTRIECGLCGHTFEEDRSQTACRSCPVGAGCGLVRCPSCGYENPRSPGWLEALRGWLGRAAPLLLTLPSAASSEEDR